MKQLKIWVEVTKTGFGLVTCSDNPFIDLNAGGVLGSNFSLEGWHFEYDHGLVHYQYRTGNEHIHETDLFKDVSGTIRVTSDDGMITFQPKGPYADLWRKFEIHDVVFVEPRCGKYQLHAESARAKLRLRWLHTNGLMKTNEDGGKLHAVGWEDLKKLRGKVSLIIPTESAATWALAEYDYVDAREPKVHRTYRVLYTTKHHIRDLSKVLNQYLKEHGLTKFDVSRL